MESIRTFVTDLNLGPWPNAGLIVLGSIILAKAAEMILVRILARLARKTTTDIDDEAIAILHRPIFLTVLFIGLAVALLQLELSSVFTSGILSVLKTLGIFVWLGAILRLTTLLLTPLSQNEKMTILDASTVPLFSNLIKMAAVAGGIYMIFLAWHIDATAWLASAGIVGIAVGFAAKDTLANLFAGVFILADAPYKIGDFINLDSGERGEVSHIGLRSTRILTRDDIEVTIPNSVIGSGKIVNETSGRWPRERIRVKVGVAYGTDIDKVQQILLDVGAASDVVCHNPEPIVRLRNFGASGLDFELLCWIEEPVLRGRVLHSLNSDIYKRFAEEGVEIPFPKRDLYVKSMPPSGD